jgi:uncharacterized membrane protein
MSLVRRTAILRVIAMIGVGVSAVLVSDHLHPGRAFCPLADACAAAAHSDLGAVLGVPTSLLGLAAFGALFGLTLLSPTWTRPLLLPAGLLSTAAGIGLLTYQYLALDQFCPLCLVADGSGIAAGLATIGWPHPPLRRSGRTFQFEQVSARVAWALALVLVAAAPFAWPRPQEKGWRTITPLGEDAFVLPPAQHAATQVASASEAKAPAAAPAKAEVTPPAAPVSPASVPAPAAPRPAAGKPSAPVVPAVPGPGDEASPDALAVRPDGLGEPPADAAPSQEPKDPVPPTAPAPQAKPASKPEPEPEAQPAPLVVEYLNAFCPHCRATHRRLERVIASMHVPVRRRRVYTWGGRQVPMWARACAIAATVGRERALFAALLEARKDTPAEIYAAAGRVGIDLTWLRAQLARGTIPPRLVRDQRLVQRAQIRALPTLDIGRRRLSGSQSERELRAALVAAVDDLTP